MNLSKITLILSFITEVYDKNDLIFFLFVRSILEKEMGIQIFSSIFKYQSLLKRIHLGLKKEHIDLNLLEISMKQCFHIVTNVFGQQDKELINKFSIMIKSYFSNLKQFEKEKQQKMKAYHFLYLLLQEYHQNKLDSQSKINTYGLENRNSYQNFREIDTSFNAERKPIENNIIATTTKNLKPEFDHVFNEMKQQKNQKPEKYYNETNLQNSSNIVNEFETQNDSEKVSSCSGNYQNSLKDQNFSVHDKKILFTMELNVQE